MQLRVIHTAHKTRATNKQTTQLKIQDKLVMHVCKKDLWKYVNVSMFNACVFYVLAFYSCPFLSLLQIKKLRTSENSPIQVG